jgi:hypothetical protein
MSKIFRKTRQQLLSSGKTTKYLKYAIGEIILVVIGILIALGINNLNQQQKNEEKITSILKEIQSDILLDLKASNEVIEFHIDSDFACKKILNNKYKLQDIRSINFKPIGFVYSDFKTASNGFDNLSDNLDKIPEKYKHLLPEIKSLYIMLKTNIHVANTKIRSVTYENVDELTKFNWYLDLLIRKENNEMEDYFLNDIGYKNLVAKYMEYSNPVFKISTEYRIKAIDLYLKINEAIKSKIEVPEIVTYNNKSSDNYTGVYKLKETLNVDWVWPPNLNVIEKENQLAVIYPTHDNFEFKIRSYNENTYFFYELDGGFLIFDKLKKGQLYFSGGVNVFAIYERIESN